MNKTRSILVSTSKDLLRVDIETEKIEKISTKYALYYGITWDTDYIYVAGRWYPSLMPTSHIERPRLLVLNRKIELIDVRQFSVPARGLHQIFCHENTLYCTCSHEDSIVIGNGQTWSTWCPSGVPENLGKDHHHFNSVWIVEDRLFIVAHNNGPSEVWEFSLSTKERINTYKVGTKIHNIWLEDNQLMVCNSGKGVIETVDGTEKCVTGSFPRGVVISKDVNIVGISAVANRSNRLMTRGYIHVYSKSWKRIKSIDLGRCGQVCDIRSLDSEDLAHNGISPPL